MTDRDHPKNGPYYAKDGMVWKRPEHKSNPDGSTTITVGFPVCKMHDCVGPDAAAGVAHLMNVGTRADT